MYFLLLMVGQERSSLQILDRSTWCAVLFKTSNFLLLMSVAIGVEAFRSPPLSLVLIAMGTLLRNYFITFQPFKRSLFQQI